MSGLIKLRLIGIGRPHDFRNPHYNRRLGIAMVEQHVVADGHRAHEIACLIVPHAIPTGRLLGRFLKILD
jgi:hypothetical protein